MTALFLRINKIPSKNNKNFKTNSGNYYRYLIDNPPIKNGK
jgi:hypothetical protein